ncbi:MAG: hypothetical protein ACFFD1_05860 [Candidatus Thorarchaeota archaeon]
MAQFLDLKLLPLAGETLGTRSMAISVQGKTSQFIFDPGVALAPQRYNLPPHSMERERRKQQRENILSTIKSMPVEGFWVSHYHLDHYPNYNEAVKMWNPNIKDFPDSPFYIKHPKENLNKNQRRRARKFVAALKRMKKQFFPAENCTINLGDFTISGSPILPHGDVTKLGYVIGCNLTYKNTKLCFTGDIMGAPFDSHVEWLIQSSPDILIIDGPTKDQIKAFRTNFQKVIDNTEIKYVIIEHHLLRSEDWHDMISNELDSMKSSGIKFFTYADILGKKIELLEVMRKNLYEFLPETSPIPANTKNKRKKS